LFRTVHAVAINNIFTTANNTVFNFRYGYTQFVDDDIPNQFDPATLGFSQNFLGAIPFDKFPRVNIAGYGTSNFSTFGDRDPQDTTFYGHNVNASVSKLFGSHTLKGGFDYRIIGMKLFARGQPSGRFSFDSEFTRGPNPLVGGSLQHGLASFLLGFPTNKPGNQSNITIGTPADFFINYYAGYVHDDWRVSSKLTLFAPSVIEAPHRFNVSGVYELPFGKGRKYLDKGGAADWFLGGWQVAAIGSYQSGFPV
jgi:hypothetical protein